MVRHTNLQYQAAKREFFTALKQLRPEARPITSTNSYADFYVKTVGYAGYADAYGPGKIGGLPSRGGTFN